MSGLISSLKSGYYSGSATGSVGKNLAISVAFLLLIVALCYGSTWIDRMPTREIFAPLGISFVMSAVPVMICLVQTTSKKRQIIKIKSLEHTALFDTAYCKAARTGLDAISPATISGDYILPMSTFVVVTSISCLIAFSALLTESLFNQKVSILGGMKIIQAGIGIDELQRYQEGTFVVACMAFIGSYVYMLSRLLDRVGNNDLAPISLHYYSARIVIACLVAAVFRHIGSFLGIESVEFMVLVGFAIGIAPDLFIVSMIRRAFQWAKVFGSKRDPIAETRPASLPLLMIDDLTRDKVDRLSELGIDSAQVLACQNPFMIWPKLPYDLGLLVDWIAAAQLYSLLKEGPLKAARERYIVDIFDLHVRAQ